MFTKRERKRFSEENREKEMTSFVLFTGLEILASFVIIIEVINKDRLIDFEDRIILRIRKRLKKKAKKQSGARNIHSAA